MLRDLWNKYKQRQRILTNADPGLLALAYAVSIAEERHIAANELEEKEKLFNHDYDCVTTRKRFLDMLGKIIFSLLINSKISRCEVVKREISN
jgi:hypothetical protein